MSKHQFIDADGDTYTATVSPSGDNITIEYLNGESGETDFLIFKLEDWGRMANMIINAARGAKG